VRYVDGSSGTSSPYNSPTAARYLKAASGWNNSGNGEDTYGFAALPGGNSSSVIFANVGNNGLWWSATEGNAYDAYYRDISHSTEGVYYYNDSSKDNLLSVRCVQD
jgi:uncharacterized protein (TIGR02145 family)